MASTPSVNRDLRIWFLMRGLDESTSLAIPLAVVVEEEREDLYSATALGFEGRIVAMGESEAEAEQNAIALVRGMVDHAIERQIPPEQVMPEDSFKRIPVPISEAGKVFKGLEGALRTLFSERVDTLFVDDWRAIPGTPFVPALQTA